MFKVYQRFMPDAVTAIHDQIVLDYDQREKGRFKALSIAGIEVRIFLERGKTLEIGEILLSECGKNIAVLGAQEELMTAATENTLLFSRACYHLGNRHVKLQLGDGWLRIRPDYVLKDLLIHLGLDCKLEQAVFEPESGAYFKSHGVLSGHDKQHQEHGHRHHHH